MAWLERKYSTFEKQKKVQRSLTIKGLANYDQSCVGKNHSGWFLILALPQKPPSGAFNNIDIWVLLQTCWITMARVCHLYMYICVFRAPWVIHGVWPGLRTVGLQWRGRTRGKGQGWSRGNQGGAKESGWVIMVAQTRVVQVGLEKTRMG